MEDIPLGREKGGDHVGEGGFCWIKPVSTEPYVVQRNSDQGFQTELVDVRASDSAASFC